MMRDMLGAQGFTVIWPAATPTGASSFDGIARSLDVVQERLEAVEASLATRAPHTPPAEELEQELREIRLLVAQLTANLLGADHPLVAQLVSHERPREVVAPAESTLGSWLASASVHRPVHRVVSILNRWLPVRA